MTSFFFSCDADHRDLHLLTHSFPTLRSSDLNYRQDRVPAFDPDADPNLFSVLGTVAGVLSASAMLNRADFAAWLEENAEALRARIDGWIPHELSAEDRADLLETMISDCLDAVDEALRVKEGGETQIGRAHV